MGKRLLPITEHIPKPMIKIMGRPFLESLIYSLKQSGFKNINISVNYLKEHFINYFGNGNNLSIKYLIEKTARYSWSSKSFKTKKQRSFSYQRRYLYQFKI